MDGWKAARETAQTRYHARMMTKAHSIARRLARVAMWFLGPFVALLDSIAPRRAGFAADIQGSIEARALNIVMIFVGAFIVLAALSILIGPFFGYVGSFTENITTVDLGSSTAANLAESILQVLIIVFLIAAAFFPISYALGVLQRKGSK